jgi:flagellar biosynthesis chaperone FliJ
MIHSELVEIRKIRQKISEKYDHDLNKLLEHYKALEAKLKAEGQYKFVQRNNAEQTPIFK